MTNLFFIGSSTFRVENQLVAFILYVLIHLVRFIMSVAKDCVAPLGTAVVVYTMLALVFGASSAFGLAYTVPAWIFTAAVLSFEFEYVRQLYRRKYL